MQQIAALNFTHSTISATYVWALQKYINNWKYAEYVDKTE